MRARLATLRALLEQAVEIAGHVSVRGEVLRGRSLDRLRQALDEAVERLLAEALRQLVEAVAGGRLHEVVFLEFADPAADVARQGVELVDPASGRFAEHRPEGRVRGGVVLGARRLVEAALEPRPLLGDAGVQLPAPVGPGLAETVGPRQPP